MMREQSEMHQENQRRLDTVLKFQISQEDINKRRDEQISLLRVEALLRRARMIPARVGGV